ncbi:MAG: PD-(D/E)XK nuclease family protein [Alphaproteobacteria bacterium]|nr:PD-(D/E)XK nuclease family protein [Alphaproteobacteria bacterium]
MSKIFNIELGANFLETAANILCQEHFTRTAILPNKRSCRELKKHILTNAKTAFLPQIVFLSDCIGFDSHQITFEIINILKDRYTELPINILYDLSFSIGDLIKNFVLNNSDYSALRAHVPVELTKYWEITEILFRETLKNSKIVNAINVTKQKIQAFIEKNAQAALLGLSPVNYYTKKLIERVLATNNGIIITCGMESDSLNGQLAKNTFNKAPIFTNVPRETFSPEVKQCTFTSRTEEAIAISTAVRESLARKKSVMVVSPDKSLTRQIQAHLKKWNIIADSSIGKSFSQTHAGILFSLILDMIDSSFETNSVINVLKMSAFKEEIIELELWLRKKQAVSPNFFEATKIQDEKYHPAPNILNCSDKLSQISVLDGRHLLADWLDFCLQYVVLIDENAAAQIREISQSFYQYSNKLPEMTFSEFAVFFKTYVAEQNCTQAQGFTPNVTILGAIEAQLLHADKVIIAEANEQAWTTQNNHDCWITPAMRRKLNIPSADIENEFLQCVFERLINKSDVLITRADIVDGAKQQPYKFYEKLATSKRIEKANDITELLLALKQNCSRKHLKFQPPCPPTNVRPTKMYASDVELLFNNPYAFYAKKILNLRELPHVNEHENIRGKYIHDVLSDFVKYSHDKTDAKALSEIAAKTLQNNWLSPLNFGIWYFRIKKIFAFITANMVNNVISYPEHNGACSINIDSKNSIELAARADRIDVSLDGEISIIDYKTGITPSKTNTISGDKPQLSIEAAIGLNNGFHIDATNVVKMSFWKLDGKNAGGTILDVATNAEEIAQAVANMLEKLSFTIGEYNVRGAPYNINIHAEYGDAYKHLARVKEWYNAE